MATDSPMPSEWNSWPVMGLLLQELQLVKSFLHSFTKNRLRKPLHTRRPVPVNAHRCSIQIVTRRATRREGFLYAASRAERQWQLIVIAENPVETQTWAILMLVA